MKSVLLLFMLCNSSPEEWTSFVKSNIILLKTAQLEVSLENEEVLEMFISVKYIEQEESIQMETHENIHSILIYNSQDVLEFMLPVMSNKVTLGKSMFEAGHKYKLGFNFQNQPDLCYADVALK